MSNPLKIVMRTRIAAGTAVLLGLSAVAEAAPPDMTGYWMVDRYIEEVKTLDGRVPPLKPEAKALYEQHKADRKAGRLEFDLTAKCVSPGVPRMMFLPYAVEFLQRPHELTILFAWNHLYRNIDLSGKPAVADYPMYTGASSGQWEGNTLVIQTTGLKEEALLDAAGLPGSLELKVTERYTMQGKKLTNVITIDDPANYTKTWQTQVTYHRLPDSYEFFEDVCLDRIDAGQPAIAKGK